MYILTDKENKVITISKTLDYQKNGNYLVNEKTLAIVPQLIENQYEVDEVIDEKYNSGKYCYTKEEGFYKDPNYIPYYQVEERVAALEEAMNSLLGFGGSDNE